MSTRFRDDVPVLIAGAGPIGLGMAAELGLRGIECRVVEQGEGLIRHPRANIVNARTMEICRRWGIAEKIRAASLPQEFANTVLHVTSVTGWELSRIDPGAGGSIVEFSPEDQQRCNQLYFDPIVRDLAASLEPVEICFGVRFIELEQDDDGVTATVEDVATGERSHVRASYLIDCTGGNSPIRDQLGIGLEGTPVLGHSVNIFFRSPEFRQLHDKGDAAMFMITGPKGVWANIVAVDAADFWRLTVQGIGPEIDLTSERIADWMDQTVGARFTHEIEGVVRWTRRTVVTERFREGRILLAGDSAHQLSPSGGFGMNTGMGDVDNLGWKLEALLKGWGGSGLLHAYDIERKPVAQRNLNEAAGAFHGRNFSIPPTIFDDTAEGAAVRRELGERIDRETSSSFRADGVVFDYRYAPSPIVVADGTAEPPYEMTRYEPTSRPGGRAPHAWVTEGWSVLDLFGRGFVLLRFGEPESGDNPLAEAARHRGVPLSVHDIARADIAALYQRRLILIRPDGHVAWRGDSPPADPLSVIDRVRGAVF